MSEIEPPLQIHHQNDHLISFYGGRQPYKRSSEAKNWFDDSAMELGTAMYAIYSGEEAVVYDSCASVAHAEFVRAYLAQLGVRKFTVVLSHWHLDHIAGNIVFDDCDIIATALTREAMVRHKNDIEAGKVWGPPGISPLKLPNVLFDDRKHLSVGEIALELRRRNIHSIDSCVVYLPGDRILLAGDTLEDPLTYMIEVENLADHLKELKEMKRWDIAKILPNHGRPDVIKSGGFETTLIDATIDYVTEVLTRAHDADFLQGSMEDYLARSATKGWITPFEPYREVHGQNLKLVHDYWKDRKLPKIAA
jgi:cyclase